MVRTCLIVEDHQLFARGVIGTLCAISPSLKITSLTNESSALATLEHCAFDLVITDLYLDSVSTAGGQRIIRQAKRSNPASVCVGMSADASPLLIRSLRDSGADHFFHKVISEDQFFEFFDLLLSGARSLQFAYPAQHDGEHPLDLLTVAELRVSKLLIAGISNKEIAGSLALAENTIKKYVHSICQKTTCVSRTEFTSKFSADLKHITYDQDE